MLRREFLYGLLSIIAPKRKKHLWATIHYIVGDDIYISQTLISEIKFHGVYWLSVRFDQPIKLYKMTYYRGDQCLGSYEFNYKSKVVSISVQERFLK